MKVVAKIVAGSVFLFLVAAMIEEREVFVPFFLALAGGSAMAEPPADPLSEADRQAAIDTVRELLGLWGHLQASGGDARFVERMPASSQVVDEMMTEIAYLQHNARRQEPKLMKLEVVQTEAASPRLAAVTTREFWIVRTFSAVHSRQEIGPPASSVIEVRYLLERDGGHWRVVDWNRAPASPTQGAAR